MLPPNYTKSVTVVAKDGLVEVTATYEGQNGNEEVTVTLEVDQSHTFPEKTEDMGSWTAVKKIIFLSGTSGGLPFRQDMEQHCEGIHNNLEFSVHPNDGVVLLSKN